MSIIVKSNENKEFIILDNETIIKSTKWRNNVINWLLKNKPEDISWEESKQIQSLKKSYETYSAKGKESKPAESEPEAPVEIHCESN